MIRTFRPQTLWKVLHGLSKPTLFLLALPLALGVLTLLAGGLLQLLNVNADGVWLLSKIFFTVPLIACLVGAFSFICKM
jgi:hypothetical protein